MCLGPDVCAADTEQADPRERELRVRMPQAALHSKPPCQGQSRFACSCASCMSVKMTGSSLCI